MTTNDERGFIVPPPSIPVKRAADAEPDPVDEPAEFISLPPGIIDLDSSTHRVATPRVARLEHAAPDAPVFFPVAPVAPAAPVAPIVAPAPPVSAPETSPVAIPAVTPAAIRSWHLVLPDQTRVELAGATLVGRDPAPMERWPAATLLAVTDPGKSVSKTHLALEIDDEGMLVAHDLDSTNGVYTTAADGTEVDLEPGRAQRLASGSTLTLGQFVIAVGGV